MAAALTLEGSAQRKYDEDLTRTGIKLEAQPKEYVLSFLKGVTRGEARCLIKKHEFIKACFQQAMKTFGECKAACDERIKKELSLMWEYGRFLGEHFEAFVYPIVGGEASLPLDPEKYVTYVTNEAIRRREVACDIGFCWTSGGFTMG